MPRSHWVSAFGVYTLTESEFLSSVLCNLWQSAEENDLCCFRLPGNFC